MAHGRKTRLRHGQYPLYWGAALIVLALAGGTAWWATRQSDQVEHPLRVICGTSSSVSTGLLSIAAANGYFSAEGLRVAVRRYRSAAVALEEMLEGSIQMAGVAETPLVYTRFERDDFRIFAVACTSSSDPKIVARRDSGVETPADLKGKRIGSTKKGQSAHFFLSLFLLKYDIREEEVAVIHDSPDDVVDRLKTGDFQAAALFEPYASRAASRLGDQGRLFEEVGLYHKTFCLTARPEFIDGNGDAVKRFLRALIRAEAYLQEYRDPAKTLIALDLGASPPLVERFMANASFTVELPPSLLATMKDQARWAMERQFIDAAHPPEFQSIVAPLPLRAIDASRVGDIWKQRVPF